MLPNEEYWFRVYAEDLEAGTRGMPSPAVGFATGEEVSAPQVPQDVKLTHVSPNHWSMSWNPSPASGGEEATYLIEVFDLNQTQWRKLASGVQKTAIEMKQLKPDQEYQFRVKAVNSAGTSSPSETISKPVEPADVELPAPIKLMLVELSPTLVWLIWQPPPEGIVFQIFILISFFQF